MVQPDVLVLCDKSKYRKTHIFGAPDLVVEVFSPSTRMKDRFIKLGKYRSARVREYWMVDPQEKTVLVYRMGDQEESVLYRFADTIPVGIFHDELKIDFSQIDEAVRDWL